MAYYPYNPPNNLGAAFSILSELFPIGWQDKLQKELYGERLRQDREKHEAWRADRPRDIATQEEVRKAQEMANAERRRENNLKKVRAGLLEAVPGQAQPAPTFEEPSQDTRPIQPIQPIPPSLTGRAGRTQAPPPSAPSRERMLGIGASPETLEMIGREAPPELYMDIEEPVVEQGAGGSVSTQMPSQTSTEAQPPLVLWHKLEKDWQDKIYKRAREVEGDIARSEVATAWNEEVVPYLQEIEGQTVIDPVTREPLLTSQASGPIGKVPTITQERRKVEAHKPTEGQLKSAAYGDSLFASHQELLGLEKKAGFHPTGAGTRVAIKWAPEVFLGANAKQYRDAATAFVDDLLYWKSGANVKEEELERALTYMVPVAGDTPEIVQMKARRRARWAGLVARAGQGGTAQESVKSALGKELGSGETTGPGRVAPVEIETQEDFESLKAEANRRGKVINFIWNGRPGKVKPQGINVITPKE